MLAAISSLTACLCVIWQLNTYSLNAYRYHSLFDAFDVGRGNLGTQIMRCGRTRQTHFPKRTVRLNDGSDYDYEWFNVWHGRLPQFCTAISSPAPSLKAGELGYVSGVHSLRKAARVHHSSSFLTFKAS